VGIQIVNKLNFIPHKFFLGLFCTLILSFISLQVLAINRVQVKISELQIQNWQLHNISMGLSNINETDAQIQLKIQHLQLPTPFNKLEFFEISCKKFVWQPQIIECLHAQAYIKTSPFQLPKLKFSFHIEANNSYFNLHDVTMFAGKINLQATLKQQEWQIKLNGQQIKAKELNKFLQPQVEITQGKVNFQTTIVGDFKHVHRLNAQLSSPNLSLQTATGNQAGENLAFKMELTSVNKDNFWLWNFTKTLTQGGVYIAPIFIQADKALDFTAKGAFYPTSNKLEVDTAIYTHPDVGKLKAYGNLTLQPFQVDTAQINGQISNLKNTIEIYLAPFTETTALEGLNVTGKLEGGLQVTANKLTEINLIAQSLTASDANKKLDLQQGHINFNWSTRANYRKKSYFNWQKLQIAKIPIAANQISILFKQSKLRLLKPLQIALLDGVINIQQFNWQSMPQRPPKLNFSGTIEHVSLAKLAQTLGWKPLTGSISGAIPEVQFEQDLLQLKGGLQVKVFGGEIMINKLAVSGLSTDFSQFYSDIQVDKLDLDLLSQRFEFGGIKGNVSGYIHDLYLENWKPTSFKAWFGTPDGDDSEHEISQTAVENLATIGGGGAVDKVSRLFLNLFDSFGYKKIGLGCHLKNGVCQLMGVKNIGSSGYFIVQGGGLPQINVMGYNPAIDWAVLWQRLGRITHTGDIIVE